LRAQVAAGAGAIVVGVLVLAVGLGKSQPTLLVIGAVVAVLGLLAVLRGAPSRSGAVPKPPAIGPRWESAEPDLYLRKASGATEATPRKG
jgi:hypothetical protein